jgi:hypothetical protein
MKYKLNKAEQSEFTELNAEGPETWETMRSMLSSGRISKEEVKKLVRAEKFLEMSFGKLLRDRNEHPQHQVRCSVGIADIVTDIAIYELKTFLTPLKCSKLWGKFYSIAKPSIRHCNQLLLVAQRKIRPRSFLPLKH